MKSVRFFTSGVEVPSEDILRMEVYRARHMMSKLMEKLNSQQMADLFADEIAAHDAMEEDWRQRSNGVFARSFATAHVAEGSGAEFLDWFWAGYGETESPPCFARTPNILAC